MNISKTKRNFIGLNTLFAILSAGVGAVILHVALPGHYFGGYPFIPTYFYLFGFVQYLYVRCVSAACSAKDVTAVFGNKNGKDDSFDNSSLDLLPCRA